MKTNRIFSSSSGWAAWVMAGLLIFNVALALAQSKDPLTSRKWDGMALAKVPANERLRRNPLDGDPDAAAAGRKLFDQHCSECHGKDAIGRRRGPSLRSVEVHEATPGELFFILTNGIVRHGMPVWSKLPEPERWQVVSFLKSLNVEQGR